MSSHGGSSRWSGSMSNSPTRGKKKASEYSAFDTAARKSFTSMRTTYVHFSNMILFSTLIILENFHIDV